MRPNYNKNTGDSYSASEWGQLKSKCNEPGLNTALTTAKKFDDEYYPPPQTISANETWTIDATNAGNGNGFVEIITASGAPTLTFTGFTIRKRLLEGDIGQAVTLDDGHEYTILSIKRGSFYDLYVSDNSIAPIQTLSAPTLELTAQNASLDYAISNEDPAATGGVLTYDTNSDFSTEIPVPGYIFATKNGNISGLVNGTPYYVRLINTASGYNDSVAVTISATPDDSYDVDAQALFDKWATAGAAADDTRKGYVNTAILALKGNGDWAKMDQFLMIPAHSESVFDIAWKGNDAGAVIGSPTYTINKGYLLDGSTQAIMSGFTPFNDYSIGSLNDMAMISYDIDVGQSYSAIAGAIFGCTQITDTITALKVSKSQSEGAVRGNISDVTGDLTSGLTITHDKQYAAVRPASNSKQVYYGLDLVIDEPVDSILLPNIEISLGADNHENNGLQSFSKSNNAYFIAGSSSIDLTFVRSTLITYLTNIGAFA